MKKLEIIIRPEKLEALKDIINSYSLGGMTVFSVMGCGVQKGDVSEPGRELKGLKVTGMNLIPKIQINTVVSDDVVDDVLTAIHEKITSGRVGDGKVFVYTVEEAMRIRTGDRGNKAL
jgi:nitrogen regulatory protein P-II 1